MSETNVIRRLEAAGLPPQLSRFGEWADRHFKWVLVAPAVLLILALSIYPLVYSLVVSFINFDFQVPGHAFVGFKNFERVIADPVARWSLVLTAFLSFSSVAIEFILGFAVAMTMMRSFPGRGLIMSILIVPLFISPVIVGQTFTLLLQRPFGPTNYVLSALLGNEVTISWLTESPYIYFSLILADVWQWTPFMFVILLAGLTAIPPNLYEAAELDGVGPWQVFWSITVPHLGPMILLAITFRLLDAIRLFDTIFIMTGGGPGTSTYTASYYLYTIGFTQFHLSQATAGSWLFLIFTALVVVFLVRRLLKAETN
ncbi:carbohydrate ABC transporter permease [Bauldia litoralis]|uniref:Multiple sugar transport system permease protein n=1 Tax=Bauldia litoralis TaxID=665467 RepID=A0A1G6CR65_9HYPH|nr:sugar ABC transporter permease [Bauldia litoralis]SDB35381.1 multiple sugar transport system permease protein [Bauldia litoralis]